MLPQRKYYFLTMLFCICFQCKVTSINSIVTLAILFMIYLFAIYLHIILEVHNIEGIDNAEDDN